MPRLARDKASKVWFNDFQRTNRKVGDVLVNVQRSGKDPAQYEEVELTFEEYDTEELAFFAAARAVQAVQDTADNTNWANARQKFKDLLTSRGFTAGEVQQFAKRALGE